jgi:hypothetical protein
MIKRQNRSYFDDISPSIRKKYINHINLTDSEVKERLFWMGWMEKLSVMEYEKDYFPKKSVNVSYNFLPNDQNETHDFTFSVFEGEFDWLMFEETLKDSKDKWKVVREQDDNEQQNFIKWLGLSGEHHLQNVIQKHINYTIDMDSEKTELGYFQSLDDMDEEQLKIITLSKYEIFQRLYDLQQGEVISNDFGIFYHNTTENGEVIISNDDKILNDDEPTLQSIVLEEKIKNGMDVPKN